MTASVTQARRILRRRLTRERGTIEKDWGGRLPVALIFPHRYAVAMSNLGFQTLYGLFNAEADIVCERLTWEGSAPALSLESQRPLAEFPVWAFSVSFEPDYIQLVSLIRESGVPLWAAEREEGDPIVLGGGMALSANPEPVAPFLDAIVLGEAEPVLEGLLETLRAGRDTPREQILAALAGLEGVYVPTQHDGRPVNRVWAADISSFATASVVLTRETEFGDVYLVEVARGCRWGCRFCLAGHLTRPPRFRSLEQLRTQFAEGLRRRGRIGLLGAAVSDHPELDGIVRAIREMGGGFTVASVRADQLSPTLLQGLRASGTRMLTLAPEVATAGLVGVVSKGFGEDELLRGVEMARDAGLHRLKLYFMVGLPQESEQDVQAIVDLVQRAKDVLGRGEIRLSVAPFVPKAHTPFQWAAMLSAADLRERLRLLEKGLRPLGVRVEGESVAWSRVQGVLARGDRRLATVLARLEEASLGAWRRAMAGAGLTEQEYLRERTLDEEFPWEVVRSGMDRAHLRREWERAQEGAAAALCRPESGCTVCGVCPPGAP